MSVTYKEWIIKIMIVWGKSRSKLATEESRSEWINKKVPIATFLILTLRTYASLSWKKSSTGSHSAVKLSRMGISMKPCLPELLLLTCVSSIGDFVWSSTHINGSNWLSKHWGAIPIHPLEEESPPYTEMSLPCMLCSTRIQSLIYPFSAILICWTIS